MRPLILLAAATLTATTTTALLILPETFDLPPIASALLPKRPGAVRQDHLQSFRNIQKPMAQPTPNDLGPQIPQTPDPSDSTNPNSDLTIADILPTQRQINIFAQLTRDIESLTSRLESSLPGSNTTLLAPLNSAMKALPRKPWEDRPDDDSGVSAASSEDKAAKNLRRFVLEHVVGVSPWEEGVKVRTLWDEEEGKEREIWWEKRGGGDDGSAERKVIMPGEVVVESVVGRVGNGEVWSLKGVVNYE